MRPSFPLYTRVSRWPDYQPFVQDGRLLETKGSQTPPTNELTPPFDNHKFQLGKQRAVPLGGKITRNTYKKARTQLQSLETASTSPTPHVQPSPLVDARLRAARERYDRPKDLPARELAEAEGGIMSDPYARILASPIRMCQVTQARLPSSFLIPFDLRMHPVTGKPWQVPMFARSKSVPTSWLLGMSETMDHVSKMPYREFTRVIPTRWKLRFSQRMKEIVFRSDMTTFLLKKMRKRLQGAIEKAALNKTIINDLEEEGAVIWLHNSDPPSDLGHREVFDMRKILGSVEELNKEVQSDFFVIKKLRENHTLLHWIWKIQLYLKP